MLSPARVRADFPALARKVHNRPLVYLDSAASSQRPASVLATVDDFCRHHYASIHRGIHTLSEEATRAYEMARDKVAAFIDAPDRRGVVFVRNATEAINLVAHSWGRENVHRGDSIVVTEMEHHSNLVPWQVLAHESGAELVYLPVGDDGRLQLEKLDEVLTGPAKLIAVTHVSNVLGTINPVREIVAMAHRAGVLVLVDAAQSVPHMPVSVREMECDFLALSGHKMCGPTGIGVLYGRPGLLEAMPPFLTGGGMITRVGRYQASWQEVPWKFEAGTPAIAEAVGLGAAADYLSDLGMEAVAKHEAELAAYALGQLATTGGVRIIGPPASDRSGIIAFTVEGIHPHDLAQALDLDGIAIRAGLHCAEPLHARFGLTATARASLHMYNSRSDADRLVAGIREAQAYFGGG
jgi:cysteine desulfurase/selenocysteine lyase